MPAKKTEYLQIRISPEVKAILSIKAERLGLSMSEYARHLILADAKQLLDEETDPA
ncbi:hypothetical protein LJB89_02765 [Tyzzerella sp. OttesenSCG-928-J15]|nr:hypothetical protein [Tyzzerella sp. OttesenSCG-928-J15]